MDKISHEDYLRMINKEDKGDKIVVLCFEHTTKSISYGLLNCKKEEYMKKAFKDWNGESIPFIYKNISYIMLRCDYNKNFILTRANDDKDNRYKSVEEFDCVAMKRLVSMQRIDL